MPGSRLALVVATDEYLDSSLRGLSSPASDAQALASVLGDPALGQFDVEVMHNEESRDIAVRLEELLTERRPQDVVLIHFSCHGLKDESGHLYLAARDTLPTRLWSTAVDATFVNRLIRKSRAGQVLLLLDCCYGGAFERGMVARAAGDVDVGGQFEQQEELASARGRAVITASSAMEYAFEGATLQESSVAPQPSVFTSALTDGLRTGEADRDQDGLVSLGELYDHVYDRVREVNPKQTPGKWEYGTQGELVVARNPNRRLAPATLPESLQSLVAHPFAATRHGAVQELQKLAAGTNLALAATARAELVRLQSDDSRQVCTAAEAAVEATSVGASEEYVDLGRVEVDEPTTSVVELTGVPLVELSKARAEGAGITVRQVGRQVTIELDTSRPGTVDARVLVDGPAGTATIPVHGFVAAARVSAPEPVTPEPVPPRPAPALPRPAMPLPPEPAPPQPLPPEPRPVPEVERPTARLPAGVILVGAGGWLFASMNGGWKSTDCSLPPQPTEELVTWAGAALLLPVVVLTVGAVLLWVRGGSPSAGGMVTGAALAMLLLMGQELMRLEVKPGVRVGACATTSTFWLAVASSVVVATGALLALRSSGLESRRPSRARGALPILAATVILTASALAYLVAVAGNSDPGNLINLSLFVAVALTVGLAGSLLALAPGQRRALLGLTTAFCLLVALGQVQLWAGFVEVGNPRFSLWRMIEAAVAAVVLMVVWFVQGTVGRPANTVTRRSPAPGP